MHSVPAVCSLKKYLTKPWLDTSMWQKCMFTSDRTWQVQAFWHLAANACELWAIQSYTSLKHTTHTHDAHTLPHLLRTLEVLQGTNSVHICVPHIYIMLAQAHTHIQAHACMYVSSVFLVCLYLLQERWMLKHDTVTHVLMRTNSYVRIYARRLQMHACTCMHAHSPHTCLHA